MTNTTLTRTRNNFKDRTGKKYGRLVALEEAGRTTSREDRIENDDGYHPDNCRWATRSEQRRNRRPFQRARL